jgi:hypothetical protein
MSDGGVAQQWLTIAEAAARVGRSEGTIRRWRRDGIISSAFGRVREDELVRAEAAVRLPGKPKAPDPTRSTVVPLMYDGVMVGTATVDPNTGTMTAVISDPSISARVGQFIVVPNL